jgi:polysaccharide biosynthesis/export protein
MAKARSFVLAAFACACWPVCTTSTGWQSSDELPKPTHEPQTIQDYNRHLRQLEQASSHSTSDGNTADYRIGPQDLLDVNVFEAPELNRLLRVSNTGEISIPLLGSVQAAGLTALELEQEIRHELVFYMKDPHVGVLVSGIESHPVSVIGEVNKPGVFQVRGNKTLLEMLSLAQGLADQAGDEVLVMRGAGNAGETREDSQTITVDLKHLIDSKDPRDNVAIYPGDIIKVTRAGIVYVVGAVKKPGGYALRSNEQMSLLKAIALSEGLTSTSAKSRTRIIRTDQRSGTRSEITIDVGKILTGKASDMNLQPADIVFIPNSPAKNALYRGTEAVVVTASGLVIFHP